jgi:hypothetical protein
VLNSAAIQGTFDKSSLVKPVGVGLGTSMSNTDVWLTQVSSDTVYELYDGWSQGHAQPPTDTSLNGSNDLKEITFTNGTDGSYTIKFTRLLKTNDPFDMEIKVPTTSQYLIYVSGNEAISAHGKNGGATTYSINALSFTSSLSGGSTIGTTGTANNSSALMIHFLSEIFAIILIFFSHQKLIYYNLLTYSLKVVVKRKILIILQINYINDIIDFY